MAAILICDNCKKELKTKTTYGQIVNGRGQIEIVTENQRNDVALIVTDSKGDTIPTDLCFDCLKKGVGGFWGDELCLLKKGD